MKKILSLLSVMFIALGTLTSCDEDQAIGYTLQGCWEGKMYSTCTIDGDVVSVSRTEIEFLSDPFTNRSGYGYWVDYYSGSRYNRWSSKIDWKVRDGVIRIHFIQDDGYIEINDFHLNDNYFSGWFYDSDNVVCDFTMHHTSSPNWNSYDYNYGWGYYSSPYYNAKKHSVDGNTDSTTVETKTPVRTFHK